MKASARVLVVEDETDMLNGLIKMLTQTGYEVDGASTGREAMDRLDKELYDVVISDLKLPGPSGIEVLKRLRETSPDSVGIIITGFGTVDAAVEAMKLGAYDFVSKPFDMQKIKIIVRNALEQCSLASENKYLKERIEDEWQVEHIVGRSAKMLEVFDAVKKVAPTDATVLVLGESGTGKELVARYVHHLSPRNERLFTAVNCSVLRDTFLESELFGHVKGAYTGAVSSKKGLLELAHGGTFFLDEVAEVSVPVQAKLLRVLEERSFMRLGGTETINVDVRLIAATNKNLEEYVRDGRFRDDLYYRINAFTITIPPLRERREDIPLLCYHFLKKHCRKMGRRIHEIDSAAMDALTNHNWPGNVRELDKAIERAVILETGEVITAEDLAGRVSSSNASAVAQVTTLPYREAKRRLIESFDREYIEGILKDSDGNVTRAAEQAGMDRRNFQRLMKHAGIRSEEYH